MNIPLFQKYKKPDRFCIFCKRIQKAGKLTRHLKKKHSKEPEVQQGKFKALRKEGSFEYNKTVMQKRGDDKSFMKMKSSKTECPTVMCNACKGFYALTSFYKHKSNCMEGVSQGIKSKTVQSMISFHGPTNDNEFVLNVLNRLRTDEIGIKCREDWVILEVGHRKFLDKKHDQSKKDETSKNIRGDMRLLARLAIEFHHLTGLKTEEMFVRDNFPNLEKAITNVAEQNLPKLTHGNYGTKLAIRWLIRRVIEVLEGVYSIRKEDHKADELTRLIKAMKLRWPGLFSSAQFRSISRRNDDLRLPENFLNGNDVETLINHTSDSIIQELDSIDGTVVDKKTYIRLRNLAVTCLTLENGRRGDEPSRLLIQQWRDGKAGRWIDSTEAESLDAFDKEQLTENFLVYQQGKGNKMVPNLVPKYCAKALDILANMDNRKMMRIPPNNNFLFTSGKSNLHSSGWHAVHQVGTEAGVSHINATKNRHHLSEEFQRLKRQKNTNGDQDLDLNNPNTDKVFVQHLGHTEKINRDVYQGPPGVTVATIMPRIFSKIRGKCKYSSLVLFECVNQIMICR
jgi:hypothetical protein